MSNQRTKVCGSKAKYPTVTQAHAAAAAYRRRFHSPVYPYVCRYCGQWHYGHKTTNETHARPN